LTVKLFSWETFEAINDPIVLCTGYTIEGKGEDAKLTLTGCAGPLAS